jgi:hypothetical protein
MRKILENERPFKVVTESGTTYEFVDGRFFTIKEKGGYEYAIKPWVWFAFDENDPAVADGMPGILRGAERLPPNKGLRLMVYGKDDWRISTKIKKIKYIK